ncbi:MAG: hypothetical protein KF846_17450 [Cyclobacteriaceae bacterium]|nr:hypothetical protein [Cyclobacteriaceae bacterium]
MKKVVFYIVILALGFSASAQRTAPHDTTRYWIVQPSIGYTTFDLGEVNNFYDEVLAQYEIMGLTIPTQKQYPGNVLIGLSALYNIPAILRVGIGGSYSWTEAYSGYEDYAGLLEINSKISMTTIEAVVERDLSTFKSGSLYLGASGGLSFVKSDYANFVSLHEYPYEGGEIKLSGDGQGHSVQLYLGGNFSVKNFTVGLTAGYRFAVIKEIEGTIQIPMEGSYTGKLDLEHDLSGVVLTMRLGYKLYR